MNEIRRISGVAFLASLTTCTPGPATGPGSAPASARAAGGRPKLHYDLTVKYAVNEIRKGNADGTWSSDRDRVCLRSYNGKLLGDPIYARPGDTLEVTLRNELPADDPSSHGGMHHHGPHAYNTTNLHLHGMHVSPAGNADNILIEIKPGGEQHYEYQIPANHPPGTYWYHAHMHGSTAVQLASGMAGPLIIQGGLDDAPSIKGKADRILMFQQFVYAPVSPDMPAQLAPDQTCRGQAGAEGALVMENFKLLTNPAIWAGRYCAESTVKFLLDPDARPSPPFPQRGPCNATTINGEMRPTFRMRPGQIERWRYIDAGIEEPLDVEIVKCVDDCAAPIEASRLEPVKQHLIARDGIALGRGDAKDMVDLRPGYRADVLVQAPSTPGIYALVDMESDGWLYRTKDDGGRVEEARKLLAYLRVEGPPVPAAEAHLPDDDELRAHRGPVPRDITDAEVAGKPRQEVHFYIEGITRNEKGEDVDTICMNDRKFEMSDPPRELELGRAEEWHISSSILQGHPYHIHVNPFQVRDEQGRWEWRDTIFVPRGDEVTLRTRYEDFEGTFVYHCHILFHGDQGMMETARISKNPPVHVRRPPDEVCIQPISCKEFVEKTAAGKPMREIMPITLKIDPGPDERYENRVHSFCTVDRKGPGGVNGWTLIRSRTKDLAGSLAESKTVMLRSNTYLARRYVELLTRGPKTMVMIKDSEQSPAAPPASIEPMKDLDTLWRRVISSEPGDIYVR